MATKQKKQIAKKRWLVTTYWHTNAECVVEADTKEEAKEIGESFLAQDHPDLIDQLLSGMQSDGSTDVEATERPVTVLREVKTYAVIMEWRSNYEGGTSLLYVTTNIAEAKRYLAEKRKFEETHSWIKDCYGDDLIVEESETSWSAYEDGEYNSTHTNIKIFEFGDKDLKAAWDEVTPDQHYLINVPGKKGYSFMVCGKFSDEEAIDRALAADLFNYEDDADYAEVDNLVDESDIKHFTECGCCHRL